MKRARHDRRQALPLADAPALAAPARRTAVARRGLAAALLAVAAVALAAAWTDAAAGAAGPGSQATVVVLDVSGSINDSDARDIQRTLADLIRQAGPGGRIGLVLFSDIAMESLPPTAPASALEAYRRFFLPLPPGRRSATATTVSPGYPTSPWGITFSGGTSISTGLHEARVDLARAGFHGGRVILVSDLIDAPQDAPALVRELHAYASDPALDLQVRAVSSELAQPLALYRRLLGAGAVRRASAAPAVLPVRSGAPFPAWVAAAIGALAALLALNELVSVPLGWRAAEAAR